MAIVDRRCPLLLCPLDSESTPKMEDLSSTLERGSEEEKIGALKKIIHCMISGINMNRLTMQIIKFCLRSKSHEIKKLLQIYWEVLDKKDLNSGKLKPEMILVCNHLLNDLKHSNEYIRGSTLRLLCRIDEPEILEQLIPQILQNLEHRHSYVRKNSILAIIAIIQQHPQLIPDAAQRIQAFLETESNNSCKRNALQMLINTDLHCSFKYFSKIQEKISNYPETMQITSLELMRKVCRTLPVPKSIFVKCAAKLLDSQSNAVIYEAANTLLALTPLDSAVNKALEAYTRLLQTESDQNVKLIVINRLNSLKLRYERNLRTIIMDILRGLNTPNIDIRKNILSLILSLAAPNNINDIIGCLKKEIISINNCISLSIDTDVSSSRNNMEYRNLLVHTIHECAVKFPNVASQVVHLLMNYLGDESVDVYAATPYPPAVEHKHDEQELVDDEESGDASQDEESKNKHKKQAQAMPHHSGVATEQEHKHKTHHSAAYDVILFVKEIVEEYPDLTGSILEKLLQSFNEIRNEQVYRVALWIFGEYCTSTEMVVKIVDTICDSIGELPLMDKKHSSLKYHQQQSQQQASEQAQADEAERDAVDEDDAQQNDSSKPGSGSGGAASNYLTRTVVLPDGTYAQSTMAMSNKMERALDIGNQSVIHTYNLRKLLKSGEYFLASVLALTLLKLVLKYELFADGKPGNAELNKLRAKSLLIITSIIRYGVSSYTKSKMDNDSKDRMMYAMNRLFNSGSLCNEERRVLLKQCRSNFGVMLSEKRREEQTKKEEKQREEKQSSGKVDFDRMLSIRQLRGLQFSEFDEDDSLNLQKAVGNRTLDESSLRTRLSRIHQLTGFSDAIYAEAAVTVHQFDIVLDFLIINNTSSTLQNLNLELHTSGDLKIVEKPAKFTLAAKQSSRVEASIKVSSTENGVIFGNIVYDTTGATSDKNIVVMNCIHMDIMDYVHPQHCSEKKFRDMWVEFEWENKVPVNTDICNLNRYIQHIANITNMRLLTPIHDEYGLCQFLAANLHAKSIFGEHALMNVSIELKNEHEHDPQHDANSLPSAAQKHAGGKQKISGHIRIRCKSQGIALSLGEKITNGQRS
eukprot:CAMPEP_0197040008 /NCGR_PEP_ID=MMETSP1384-20130603/16759_1 /TAXON_ID=29189 /ORGANISM="Ammonia sp." /LENGTH=1091 /DNA_ID=CAMNT_0042470691 /DNA_START=39 /DNA_END=3314 /DNA_ORIENTATION=-